MLPDHEKLMLLARWSRILPRRRIYLAGRAFGSKMATVGADYLSALSKEVRYYDV